MTDKFVWLPLFQVASMLPSEAFTVVRKSFDARKVCYMGIFPFLIHFWRWSLREWSFTFFLNSQFEFYSLKLFYMVKKSWTNLVNQQLMT